MEVSNRTVQWSLEHAHTRELALALKPYRKQIVAGYLLMVGSLLGLILLLPELLGSLMMGESIEWSEVRVTTDDLLPRFVTVGVFVGLQALFIWGGGRIRLGAEPVKLRGRLVALIVFASVMALCVLCLCLTSIEMTVDWYELDAVMEGRSVWAIIGTAWLGWLGIGWAITRNRGQGDGLSRLALTILGGSWIEFTVALPVELVTRSRHSDCPCGSGSWIGLFVSIPVMLWAVGPALYLFYLRERRLTDVDPDHARLILQRKSRRERKRPKVDI